MDVYSKLRSRQKIARYAAKLIITFIFLYCSYFLHYFEKHKTDILSFDDAGDFIITALALTSTAIVAIFINVYIISIFRLLLTNLDLFLHIDTDKNLIIIENKGMYKFIDGKIIFWAKSKNDGTKEIIVEQNLGIIGKSIEHIKLSDDNIKKIKKFQDNGFFICIDYTLKNEGSQMHLGVSALLETKTTNR